jgi:hypothetical protein
MKIILVFSSVLFISIAALFPNNNVVLTSTLPNYAKPGSTVDFDVVVSKGSLGGFSKLQMIFPKGFEVEAVDVKGGTFSYIDQKLKVIWVSLPSEPKFNLAFKVKIKASASGSFPLEGQFSYIQEGVRASSTYNTQVFVAKDKPAAIASVPPAQPAVNKTLPTNDQTQPAGSAAASSAIKFEFSRSVDKIELKTKESAVVTLKVLKEGISGFGKITEVIPEGFTAVELQSNGGIFSVLNNEVRFLWMTLPASDSFEVSYKLVAGTKEGEQAVKGSFSYVEDTKTKLKSTQSTIFNVTKEQDVLVIAPKPNPPVKVEPKDPGSTEGGNDGMSDPKEGTAKGTDPNDNNATTGDQGGSFASSKPSKNTDETGATSQAEVAYRVQICATRKAVDKSYFVKYNKVNETIYADMHQGWHKFTVGAFEVYGEARNHRENVKVKNKITGPFVTAYNQGNRITVQEALMISKQEWMP